jgi:predicted phosphodiesterase
MRLWVISDVHLEFAPFAVPAVAHTADAVVLAGDIGVGDKGVRWANETFRQPVVYVLGNHEHYGGRLERVLAACRAAAAPHVHVLNNDAVEIGGTRFLGCTLWTDMALFGIEKRPFSVVESGQTLNDYRRIRLERNGYRRMQVSDSIRMHAESRKWIEARLHEGDLARTVVVTHHGPHPRSVVPGYADDLVSAAYVSDLSELLGWTTLWIHGHTHHAHDYSVNGTRIVCNPRGYPGEESEGFDPERLIELAD